MRKFWALTLCVLLCVIVFAGCSENGGLTGDIGKEATYDQAVQLLQEGNLQEDEKAPTVCKKNCRSFAFWIKPCELFQLF